MKHILTQEDLDNNPEFVEQGLKVGDEIDIPENEDGEGDEAAAKGAPKPEGDPVPKDPTKP